jgi:hypothetical protein
MAETNYTVNYEDKRFAEVESDKKQALTELEKTYAGMINSSDGYYNAQIDATREWADKQSSLQQEQTDFAIKEIEQQKEQTRKDYIKEQSGAYVDWQKQSNKYGANAEQMAAQGMTNTGYAESSQVAMYNQYQTRVTTARESYNLAIQNYNNSITEARLQNNAILAEIAYEALQQELELSLQGFQYKNSLLLEQANHKLQVENTYYQRYQDVLKQINTENALAEEVRQHNEDLAYKNAALAEEQRQFDILHPKTEPVVYTGGGGKSGGSSGKINSSSKSMVESKAKGTTLKSKGTTTIKNGAKSSGTAANSKEPTVDMSSVLALGYGPISASKLDSLIRQGKVKEYTENGKLKYKKVVTTRFK